MTMKEDPISRQANSSKPPSENDPLLPQSTHQLDSQPTTTYITYSSDLQGYLWMLLSTIGLSTMAFLVHVATFSYSFPSSSSALIRGIVHTTLATVYLASFFPIGSLFSRLSPLQRRILFFRGLSGAVGIVIMFIALSILPIGDAVSIFFINPALTMLLSHFFLSEPVSGLELFSCFTSFIGVVLIARPGSETLTNPTDRLLGSVCAFFGALLAAMAYVSIRSLGTAVHFMMTVLSLGIGTIVCSTIAGGAMGPAQLVYMKEGAILSLAAALFAFGGQCCLSRGLQLCRAGPGVLIRNLDVPIAYVLGLLFLGEKPSWLSLFGSFLVLSGTLMIGWLQLKRT